MRKCDVCHKEISRELNSIVCSERCSEIRLKVHAITDEYTPTHGCANCWGDLHEGCTDECRREFSEAIIFGRKVWDIIRVIYPKEDTP